VDRSTGMETKGIAPLTATPTAVPVPAPASHQPPPAQQHQHKPSLFTQQQAVPAPSGMRLSFEQMTGKPPEEHHHVTPMLYTPPPPQAGARRGDRAGR
jgi:hypothetical protein